MLPIPFIASLTQVQWVMVGLGGVTVLYTVFRPGMKKKDPLARSPSTASLSQQRNVERQMQNLLVELSEMARQLTAQLDTRSQKLEMLLQEADAKITELAQIAEAGPGGMSKVERQSWSVSEEPKPEISTEELPIDPRHQDVYGLADQGRDTAEIARQLGRPRGEVELILALRGKRGAMSAGR